MGAAKNTVNRRVFQRLRTTVGQGPNYVGPSCGYVGLCWPNLRAMWAQWGYVGPAWGYKEQQKNIVKRRRFWWSAAYLGAMLAHLRAMLAQLGGYVAPSWGYVGRSWGDVGPSWRYVGPAWGLCWPILRLCWPILRPMLAHVDPSWATNSEKGEKMGTAKNTVKRGTF